MLLKKYVFVVSGVVAFLRRSSNNTSKREKILDGIIKNHEMPNKEQVETNGKDVEEYFSIRMKKKRRIKHIWRSFVARCTINGLHFIFDQRTLLQRFIWCIIFLSLLAIFLWHSSASVLAYFQYKVTTSVKVTYVQQSTFPAVTICNFNKYRQSALNSTFKNFLKQKFDLYNRSGSINWTKFSDLKKVDMESFVRSVGHRLNLDESTGKGMLYHCVWKGKPCSHLNFTSVLTDMGLCYTFNSGKEGPLVDIGRPGNDYGLKLTMSVETDEYFGHDAFSSGLKIHIHDQDEQPLVSTYGFAVLPGTKVFAAVSREMTLSLEPPYETMCHRKKTFDTKPYTTADCHYRCREDYIIEQCKCRAHYMSDKRRPLCKVEEYFVCVFDAADKFTKLSLASRCKCVQSCNSTKYFAYLSYGEILNIESSKRHLANLNRTEKAAFVSKNVLSIDIYYEDLYQSVVEQVPVVKLANVLGENGGLLGLFVGASIFTLFELIDLCLSFACVQLGICKVNTN